MGDPEPQRFQFTMRRLMVVIAGLALLFGGIAWAARSRSFHEFCWLGTQALQVGPYFFPWFTRAAGLGMLIALLATVADRRIWRTRSLWLLLPIVVPFAILCFGVVFENDHHAPRPIIEQRTHVLDALPWLHIPIGIILLGCFRSIANWLVIISFSTAMAWLSFGSHFMSWMSVTNIWL